MHSKLLTHKEQGTILIRTLLNKIFLAFYSPIAVSPQSMKNTLSLTRSNCRFIDLGSQNKSHAFEFVLHSSAFKEHSRYWLIALSLKIQSGRQALLQNKEHGPFNHDQTGPVAQYNNSVNKMNSKKLVFPVFKLKYLTPNI